MTGRHYARGREKWIPVKISARPCVHLLASMEDSRVCREDERFLVVMEGWCVSKDTAAGDKRKSDLGSQQTLTRAVGAVSDKSGDTTMHPFSKSFFRFAESYFLTSVVACSGTSPRAFEVFCWWWTAVLVAGTASCHSMSSAPGSKISIVRRLY